MYVDFDRLLAVAGERVPAVAVGDPEAFVERVRALDRPSGALEVLARDDAAVIQAAADVETLREFGYVGPSTNSNATELTAELPADVTAAVGFAGLGDFVRVGLEDPLRLGITAADARSATRFWREYTGTDLDATLTGIGDAALYATGQASTS